jgi:hypothetical protein
MAIEPAEQPRYDSNLDKARSLLRLETFGKTWQEGHGMSLEQAIAYALEETLCWLPT